MGMKKWAYILLGEDKTGKTSFQKNMIQTLSYEDWSKRLTCNTVVKVIANVGSKNVQTVSFMNRSYQEKAKPDCKDQDAYVDIADFFRNYFKAADACILSSHLITSDVDQIIGELRKRFYNVCGVFFSNSTGKDRKLNEDVVALPWDEKLVIENQTTEDETRWTLALQKGATELCWHLLEK